MDATKDHRDGDAATASLFALARAERVYLAAAAAFLLLILLLNPVGFLGGGMDDWQYLNAARCWIDNGPCLPKDHWQSRWPVIAPIAASLSLFGESRWSAGLPFLLYGLAILVMLWTLFARIGMARIGSLVTLFTAAMPDFSTRLIQPNVEFPELAFLLACAHCLLSYRKGGKAGWALGAGLFFALAVQARETAAVALPILLFLAWKWARHDIRALVAAAIGAAIPTAAELILFYLETGNPLYRRMLSVGHTELFSTELEAQPDGRPPFFNSTYIANWRHEPGIDIHWSVNGLVNLVFNAFGGLSLLFNLLLAPYTWTRVSDRQARWIKTAAVIGAYWAFMITYALAIDPNPRMLVVPLIASQFVLAIQLGVLADRGMTLARTTIIAANIAMGLVVALAMGGNQHAEKPLARLFVEQGNRIEADYNTRRQLELVEGHEELVTIYEDRPLLLMQVPEPCAAWSDRNFGAALRVVQSFTMSPLQDLVRDDMGAYCLFEYRSPVHARDLLVARFPEQLDPASGDFAGTGDE